MFLRMIFVVCTMGVVFAAQDNTDGVLLKSFRPVSCESTPRTLDEEERAILFNHEALRHCSSENRVVVIYVDVVDTKRYFCSFATYYRENSPNSEHFITLNLSHDPWPLVRTISLYDTIRLAFLHSIKNNVIQWGKSFYSPELETAITTFLNRQMNGPAQISIPDDRWPRALKPYQLRFQVNDSNHWEPSAIRVVVGGTAFTGFYHPSSDLEVKHTCDDGSAFFEATKELQKKAQLPH